MSIWEYQPSDAQAVHQLYLRLAELLPPQPPVSLEQFVEETLFGRLYETMTWAADGGAAFVAMNAGNVVAYAEASFLPEQGFGNHAAGTGFITLLFADPSQPEACRAVLRAVIEAARARGCPELRALDGYGPRFHQWDHNGLSNAWPWIGRALVQEGFETIGWPALSLHASLETMPEPLPCPEGAELRYDWVTRLGDRDNTEGGLHLFVGTDRAAESMWHFGEKYIRKAGNHHAHLFWLGTNEPYRGRGFGRFLLRESLARAWEAGARETSLRCRMDNFYAHTLYRDAGYELKDVLWSFRLCLAQSDS